VRQKGLDILAEVAEELPGTDVIVYGEPDANEPERLARLRASAPVNFRLEPAIFGTEKWKALAAADLFVQPSRWEGLSAALLEAMAVGVPCAVSEAVARTVPMRELDLGLVLDQDPSAAAGQLADALASPARRREWGRRAATHARGTYAPEIVAAAHLELYGELIEAGNHPRTDDRRAG
jgi:glycosyltransferase involved in cell wall biosynthesis